MTSSRSSWRNGTPKEPGTRNGPSARGEWPSRGVSFLECRIVEDAQKDSSDAEGKCFSVVVGDRRQKGSIDAYSDYECILTSF